MKRYLALPLLLALALPAGAATPAAPVASDLAAAATLRHTFENNYLKLGSGARQHYSLRLYRLTGQKPYLTDVVADAYETASRLNHYVRMMDDKDARHAESDRLIGNISDGPRGQRRKAVLQGSGDLRFAMYLTYLLAKLDDLGLKHERQAELLSYLKGHPDLKKVMLEPEFIRAYAAQAANYVYWLDQLGVADIRDDFDAALKETYPDSKDAKLSKKQFKNKVYGMTHVVLAASGYYQQDLDKAKYQWITDYFLAHQQQILERTSEDVIAEVALCLELTGQGDNPLVRTIKDQLKQAIDPKAGMIPSVSGKIELSSGEHRNVLAIALLDWPAKRYPGPNLGQQAKLPFGIVAK
ncbi:DUF3541 domain-containing protein [Gallaecimonas xiamenensis]|nr:DUF3541 domain-containing protein [Gallaecimonas xiamenensis]